MMDWNTNNKVLIKIVRRPESADIYTPCAVYTLRSPHFSVPYACRRHHWESDDGRGFVRNTLTLISVLDAIFLFLVAALKGRGARKGDASMRCSMFVGNLKGRKVHVIFISEPHRQQNV